VVGNPAKYFDIDMVPVNPLDIMGSQNISLKTNAYLSRVLVPFDLISFFGEYV